MPRKLIGVLQTSGMQGPPGPEGKPGPEGVAGKGFPVGGLANQILAKKSDADYDTEWIDNNAKGNVESVNGKTGQVTLTAEDVGATTEQWVNQQNYLKSIPSEYITETELDAKGYLTEHQDISNLATKAEVSEVENKIPTKVSQLENDKGYLTEHQDLTGYAKKTDIPDVSGFITEIPAEYVTDDELNAKGYLTEHQSLANYYTKPEVNELIPDLSGYALKTEIPTVPTNVSAFNNDVGYLTEIPSEYVTETELESKGYLTEHQSLANYSTTEEMNNAISNHHDSTKQDTLTAGSNITIENNVISATGGGGGSSYTFTGGLTETDGTVSWDLNDKVYSGLYSEDSNKSGVRIGYLASPTVQRNTGIGSITLGADYNPDNSIYGGLVSKGTGSLAGGFAANASVNQFLVSNIESSGKGSIAFGYINSGRIKASGNGSVAFGYAGLNSKIFATGENSFSHGNNTTASGSYSHAEGTNTTASGSSSHAEGYGTIANHRSQHSFGNYNIEDGSSETVSNNGTYICITGNGTSNTARANAYTLDWSGNGTFAGTVSSATGADYAEYFEWKDGNTENEDRVGFIVTLDGDKIVKANSGDDILGICSGTAMVLGDSAEWNWSKRFLTDDFGRIIYEDIDVEHEAVLDEEGNVIEKAYIEQLHRPVQNPNYDSSKPYERRSDRPEWQIVGMMGKLYVRDNGTCEVNGYATVDNGIAIKSTEKTNMRVMERVTENIVRVLLK